MNKKINVFYCPKCDKEKEYKKKEETKYTCKKCGEKINVAKD